MSMLSRARRVASLVTLLTATLLSPASADTFTTGTSPIAIAVNTATNRTYVVNQGSNNVTVIDGATRTVRLIAVDGGPVALAVNITANRIYVANATSGTISVINGADETVKSIALPAGSSPQA